MRSAFLKSAIAVAARRPELAAAYGSHGHRNRGDGSAARSEMLQPGEGSKTEVARR